MFRVLTGPATRRALSLMAFVAAPLATVTALAAPNVSGTALPGTLTASYPALIAFGSGQKMITRFSNEACF